MCDNRCDFCIEDTQGISSLGKTKVDAMVASVTAGVIDGKDTVLILGGEPFLQVKLLKEFVDKIRPMVKDIYITTSLPKELDVNKPDVLHILTTINGLNVSLHHHDYKINNTILKATRNINRVALLKSIADKIGADKIRVQTNLTKEGLSTRVLVNSFIATMMFVGITNIKINELQDVPEDQYVSFDTLFPDAKLKNPFSKGCLNDVSKFFSTTANITVNVKRCCFLVQEHSPKGASLLDLCKLVKRWFTRKKIYHTSDVNVVYENGASAKGWLASDTLITRTKDI